MIARRASDSAAFLANHVSRRVPTSAAPYSRASMAPACVQSESEHRNKGAWNEDKKWAQDQANHRLADHKRTEFHCVTLLTLPPSVTIAISRRLFVIEEQRAFWTHNVHVRHGPRQNAWVCFLHGVKEHSA